MVQDERGLYIEESLQEVHGLCSIRAFVSCSREGNRISHTDQAGDSKVVLE